MTVQNVPAPTDTEQPSKTNKTIITESIVDYNHNQPVTPAGHELQTRTMTELYDTTFIPKTPVIENLLYTGVYLFVGPPKIGKSFLMAQIGYSVSLGLPLWGFQTNQGTVLYLALEDDYARLQNRLYKMFDLESSDSFHLATEAESITGGLEEQLDHFMKKYPDIRMIIIDTLQKIRESCGDHYSYASDYEIITKLKKFSDRHNICMIVVHHTRKMESSDSFEMISGTNGLLGAADGAYVLQKKKRTGNEAVLEIVGRDQPDTSLNLIFDRSRCIWNLGSIETNPIEEKEEDLLKLISDFITEDHPIWEGTASELIGEIPEINLIPNQLSRKLNILSGRLYSRYGIKYKRQDRSSNKRGLSLIFEKNTELNKDL